ncbi:ECF transporter S component [Lachnospiraceae bacterium]|jgi:hypothetical protein|nr:ECF transporter S component [Lachnospiraceae bacterium]
MKLSTRQIAATAALLAICIVSQFFKNTSVFITGPIINACIILAGLSSGLSCGIILSVITPITSFFISGSPVMSSIPAIIPCVMVGNILIVGCVCLLSDRIKGRFGLPLSMLAGCIVKALFMGVVISLILIPMFLPEKMHPKMSVFQSTFSIVQLLTGAAGCIYAHIIWIPLKKFMKNQD